MARTLQIVWTKAQFERRKGNITTFAKQIIHKNFPKGIDVNRDDVTHHWWWLVDRVFPKGEFSRHQYMSQIQCAGFHDFWAERDRLNGIYEEEDQDGFQRVKRDTRNAERSAYPGVVVIKKDGVETILPGVNYAALKDIKYRTFVRSVLEANSARTIALPEMQLIWDALIYEVFRFECACAKESKANESMGVDGFSQAQYHQLVLDVRSGVPPPRPSLTITLPLPHIEKPRKRKTSSSGSATDSDETGADEDDSPITRRQKRRSKRAHRSGPGDDFGVPGYSLLTPVGRSDPVPLGQFPSLPSIFTRPATAHYSSPRLEYEWLDPQLLQQSSMQTIVKAVNDSSDMNTMPGDMHETVDDSEHGEDDDDEIGLWSL